MVLITPCHHGKSPWSREKIPKNESPNFTDTIFNPLSSRFIEQYPKTAASILLNIPLLTLRPKLLLLLRGSTMLRCLMGNSWAPFSSSFIGNANLSLKFLRNSWLISDSFPLLCVESVKAKGGNSSTSEQIGCYQTHLDAHQFVGRMIWEWGHLYWHNNCPNQRRYNNPKICRGPANIT